MNNEAVLEDVKKLLDQGNGAEARSLLSQVVEESPDPLLYFNLGILFKKDGQMLAALKHFEKAAELDDSQGEIWNEIGLVYDELGKVTMAEGFYKKAIELNPELATAWNNLGVCSFVKEKFDEAKERFSQAVRLDPENSSAWFNLRDTLETLGDESGAAEADRILRTLE